MGLSPWGILHLEGGRWGAVGDAHGGEAAREKIGQLKELQLV